MGTYADLQGFDYTCFGMLASQSAQITQIHELAREVQEVRSAEGGASNLAPDVACHCIACGWWQAVDGRLMAVVLRPIVGEQNVAMYDARQRH